MVRPVEPTRVCANADCAHAGERQPWSSFGVKVRWPDGSTRQPKCYCKPCERQKARDYRASHPNWNATRCKAWRDKMRRTRLTEFREMEGFSNRLRSLEKGYRTGSKTVVGDNEPLLSSAPFAARLREVIARDGSNARDTAGRLGIAERTVRAILTGERGDVELNTVERALIADDTTTLRELYPSLYLEAA